MAARLGLYFSFVEVVRERSCLGAINASVTTGRGRNETVKMGGEPWWVGEVSRALGGLPLSTTPPLPKRGKQGGTVRSLFSQKSLNEGLQFFKI